MKKRLSKIETISFILRSNKTYQIMFQNGILAVDDKIVWQSGEESISPFAGYRLKLEGTGPQTFRRKAKIKLRRAKEI